jgi:hypothetical protein
MKRRAIANGAVEISPKQLVKIVRRKAVDKEFKDIAKWGAA